MNNKRVSRALLAVAIPLASQAVYAGYTFEEGDLSGELNLSAGGASISSRNVNFGVGRVDNRSGENTGTDADWQEFYLKPGVTFSYGMTPDFTLLGGASVVAANTFGDGDAGGFTRSSDGDVSTEELFAGFSSGDWKFTAGRQNYMIGTGFIVMDGNLDFHNDGAFWLGPRTAFRDSAILGWGHDALQAQAFTLAVDDDLGNFRMTGANLDYAIDGVATLGAMAMKVDSLSDSANAAVPREGMQVYNLRALGAKLPGVSDLTLNSEYAIETGSGDGTDYDASAWYGQADYAFTGVPLEPVLGYRYARFSGDSNLADNKQKSWDPLSKGFIDWSTWLIGDVVGNYLLNNTNERVQQVSLKTHVFPTVTVGSIYYQFSLDEKNLFGMPVSDRRFADETVIFVDWTPTPSWYTSLSYNWVKPKAAAKEVFDNKDFSALEMYFTYRY